MLKSREEEQDILRWEYVAFCVQIVSQRVSSERLSGLNDLSSQVVGISWDQQ